MTSSIFSSVRPALVALLVALSPVSVLGQEQPATAPAAGEKTAPETAVMPAPGTVSIPDREKTDLGVPSAQASGKTDQDGTYTIKEGDTLWDISNTFLKDPFLWPFIWKANPSIANADLIYPGNTLIIPSLGVVERAIQAPQEESKEQLVEKSVEEPKAPAEGRKEAEPAPAQAQTEPEAAPEATQEAPRLVIPDAGPLPVIDKYSMLNAGFVSEEESTDRIVGSKEEKTILGYDDIVYVSIKSKGVSAGDRFIIYHPLNKVKHPVTGRNFGRLTRVLGILELTEKGTKDIYVARITRSFDHAQKGSMLTPYQEPVLVYDNRASKSKDISGYILEVVDTRTINAQIDIIYLDKGNAEGVEPGDRFTIYPGGSKKGKYPKHAIGEAQVFLVKEHSATAIVRKSTEPMTRGDAVEYKK